MKFFYQSRLAKALRKNKIEHTVETEVNDDVYRHTVTIFHNSRKNMVVTETQRKAGFFGPKRIVYSLVHIMFARKAEKRVFYSLDDTVKYIVRIVRKPRSA